MAEALDGDLITKERFRQGDVRIIHSPRGGIELKVLRRFDDPLTWYLRNGHLGHEQRAVLRARAGKRFYVLWFYGSIRRSHTQSRYSAEAVGVYNPEDSEVMQLAYHDARGAIRGVKERQLAYDVCCEGHSAGRHGQLAYLKSALDDLAHHFGYKEFD